MAQSAELIGMKEVSRLTSLSRPYIFKLRTAGRFPSGVAIGDKRIAFVRSEIDAWIEARIADRDKVAA